MRRKSQRNPKARATRRTRRRGGVQPLTVGPDDMGFVIRGRSGQVKVYHSRGEPVVGSAGFWGYVLQWMFADTPDAAEVRKTIQEEFMQDMNELMEKARIAKLRMRCEAEAQQAVEALVKDGKLTEDQADAKRSNLVKQMMDDFEEKRVAAETAAREEAATPKIEAPTLEQTVAVNEEQG